MKVLKTVVLIFGFLLLTACVSGSSSGTASSGSTATSSGTVTGVTTVSQLSVVTAN